MARTVRNNKIDTRSARLKLAKRREPYWTAVSRGCALGYRAGAKGGSWIARNRAEDGRQRYEALGPADDALEAESPAVLSYSHAQEKAREYFDQAARRSTGAEEGTEKRTVASELKLYFEAREARGSKGVRADRYVADARIIPDLGGVEIKKLSAGRIREWLSKLSEAPKLLRTAKSANHRRTRPVAELDPDAMRARRATANRVLTILKAALNYSFQEGRVSSDEAWRKVKPFREADAAVVRYLTESEIKRIVNASAAGFRDLVRGALLTGCRYGELTRMVSSDFNAEAETVTVRLSKAGKPRHVALTEEGTQLFKSLTAGRKPRDLIFRRPDGTPWKASHQQRPLIDASKRAKIEPAVTFHVLRHTYASVLATKGAPMGVIAAQLGHADTRMTEKHYAHLAPNYVATTVRASLPKMGLLPESNVVLLNKAKP
ncbi:MAG: tyrosine-type recombinase/integrase [Hyphomicrobiales bacterium]|nr:tyrosine-type recombinase/integrase [Hyphomicrobiales bacterium]